MGDGSVRFITTFIRPLTFVAQLYEFMLSQRSEGVIEHEHKPKPTKKR